MKRVALLSLSLVLAAGGGRARACGCFTPPDPSVPVVQAGERILFAVKDSKVTAHIQIRYSGDAREFGWLLPLPSLPTLQVGTDELFTALVNSTQPDYELDRSYATNCYQPYYGGGGGGGGGGFGCGCGDNAEAGGAYYGGTADLA